MAKRASQSRRKQAANPPPEQVRRRFTPFVAGMVATLLMFLLLDALLLHGWPFTREESARQRITDSDAPLASFFTPEVLGWRSQIREWAKLYSVNPNVIAIVIQIESCGDPIAMSGAGALGLMQVMPFHFQNGENMINPDTNVQTGMDVFYQCLTQFANWDLGLALACYNGGPSVTTTDYAQWAEETQHYYRWATGLWRDVVQGKKSSSTLDDWLAAGGQRLCDQAARQAAKQKN
jgi:soluble lytic murein transglycosylase-like protein